MKTDKIDHYFLGLAVAVLPLIHWSGSSNTYGQIKWYYLATISGVYCLLKLKGLVFYNWSFRLSPLTQLLGGFGLLAALTSFWAINQPYAVKSSLLFFLLLLIYLVSSQVELDWARFSLWLQLSGLAVSSLGIVQTFWHFLRFGEDLRHPISTLGNPNFTAEFLLPILVMTIVRILVNTAGKRKLFDLFCCLVFLFTLFLCRSSGALIALVVGTIFILVLWGRTSLKGVDIKQKTTRLTMVVLVIACLAAIVMFTPYGRRSLVNFSLQDRNTSFRIHAYGSTLKMIRENLWHGVGFKNFQFQYPKYRHQEEIDRSGVLVMAKNTHNEYLQWAAETGILGIIGEICLLVLIFRMIKVNRQPQNINENLKNWGVSGGLIVILVQALFSFNLRNPASGVLFFFFLGQLSRQTEKTGYYLENPLTSYQIYLKVAFTLLAFSLITFGLFFNVRLALADYHFRRGNLLADAVKDTGVKPAIAGFTEYLRANELNPTAVEIAYRLASALLDKRKLDEAIVIYQKTRKIAPYHIPVLNNLGIAYGMRRNWQEAEKVFQEVMKLDAKNLKALTNLTTLYQETGRIKEAISFQKRVLHINRKEKLAYYNLGALYEEARLLDEALSVWEKYLQLEISEREREKIEAHIGELRQKAASD